MDRVKVLGLLRPSEHEHLTLDDLSAGWMFNVLADCGDALAINQYLAGPDSSAIFNIKQTGCAKHDDVRRCGILCRGGGDLCQQKDRQKQWCKAGMDHGWRWYHHLGRELH